MGFEPQIRTILTHVTQPHQTLLFSATWPKEIQRLAFEFLKNPVQINVGEVNALVANKDITQTITVCQEFEKFDKLKDILTTLIEEGSAKEESAPTPGGPKPGKFGGKNHAKVIVFVAKKVSCNELSNTLWDDGFAVDCLHGDRPQWERTKVMNAFKGGDLKLLIATDVASRGLDVKDVGAVVNFDMPCGVSAVEDYVHRIGRTGRAGAKGKAYTFFTKKDQKAATQLVEVLTKAEQVIPEELKAMVPRFHRGSGYGGGRGGGRGRGGGGGYSGGRGGRGYMGGGGGGFGRGGGRGGGGRRY
jgi:ATP-dependent RNA helicase DDX5/DBP2